MSLITRTQAIKSILLALVLFLGSITELYAQSDTIKIPSSTFPLLGFELGGKPNVDTAQAARLRRAWMNGVYSGQGSFAGASASLAGGMKSIVDIKTRYGTINEEDPGITPARTLIAQHFAHYDANEVRCFLAANEDHLTDHGGTYSLDKIELAPDLVNRWTTQIGALNSNKEWLTPFAAVNLDGYILKNMSAVWLGDLDRTNQVHSSFIYRFGSDASSYGATPLFQLEYRFIYHGNANDSLGHDSTIYIDSSTFSYADFADFVGSSSHPHENANLLTFPNTKYNPALQPQQYGIHYRDIWDTLKIPHCHLDHVDVWLKKLVAVDIYIRGLRMRSDLAQKILTDDSATWTEIRRVARDARDSIRKLGDSVWNNIAYFECASEPTVEDFRVIAHIDTIFYRAVQRHILPYISTNGGQYPTWYRAIYEDETGQVPPPISFENFFYFDGSLNLPNEFHWGDGAHFAPYPRDAIDYAWRSGEI